MIDALHAALPGVGAAAPGGDEPLDDNLETSVKNHDPCGGQGQVESGNEW